MVELEGVAGEWEQLPDFDDMLFGKGTEIIQKLPLERLRSDEQNLNDGKLTLNSEKQKLKNSSSKTKQQASELSPCY